MSRKITDHAVSAFYAGATLTRSNMFVTSKQMYLHGNMIAKIEEGNLFITTCGWNTPTTKERLNGLAGVRVNTKAYQLYLNGKPWDGDWIKV